MPKNKSKLKQKKIEQDLKKISFSLTKTFFFTTLLSFILFTSLTFFTGIMVGRETIPIKFDINRLDKKLEKLKLCATDLVYKKLNNDNIIKQEISTDNSIIQPDDIQKKKFENKKKSKIKKEIQHKTVKTENLKKPEKPYIKPLTKTENPGRYCVQVAAYKNIDTAGKLVITLQKEGYPAYISSSATGLHRVRIGPYKKQKKSRDIIKKLKNKHSGIYTVTL